MEKKFEIRTRKHVRDYLKKQVEKFSKKTNYSEIIINPFYYALMKDQLELQTKEKFARSLIFDGKIKGLTGSFGTKLQQIAGEFTHETPKKGFHLRIKKGKKFYNIIVVSGPQHNTSNVEKYRSKMEKSKKEFPSEIPIFGICYGNTDTLGLNFSNNVRIGLKNEKIVIGKQFWEFISGDKNCRNEILKIIEDEAEKFSESDEYETIFEALTKTSEGMNDYLSEMYGKDEKKFWGNFFRDVYI